MDIEVDVEGGVDELPAVPPTLQTDEDDLDDFYDTLDGARIMSRNTLGIQMVCCR